MSHQTTTPPPTCTLTFETVSRLLPPELILLVLEYYTGPPEFIVDSANALIWNPSNAPVYTLSYKNPVGPPLSTLPSDLVSEYHRALHLSYVRDVKTFESGNDFYMTHLLLSAHPGTGIPAYALPSFPPWNFLTEQPGLQIHLAGGILPPFNTILPIPAKLPPHPLSRIRLDFNATEYFALFDVTLPPFPPFSNSTSAFLPYADIFLVHTNHLVLHFGSRYKAANPWYDTEDFVWCSPFGDYDYGEPRCRPYACDSGAIVDWTLEWAWEGGSLQAIDKVEIEGDVQDWVKTKWENIFTTHAVYKKIQADLGKPVDQFAIHKPDIAAIRARGIGVYEKSAEKEEDGEITDPRELFPPSCKCKVGCWRLSGRKVLDEPVPEISSWDLFEEGSGKAEGGWMDGVELGMDI